MLRRGAVGVLLLGTLLLAGTTALPGDKIGEKEDAKWQPIKVSYHANSFFIVESSKGYRVAFDPHLIPEYGRPEGLKANLVTYSHNHNDHTMIEALENFTDPDKTKQPRLIRGLKGFGLRADWNTVDETIGDIKIRSVSLYHDDMEGLRAGKVTAFIVEMDGWRICHLGDLGHLLTKKQLNQIGEVDVLMIPVGGIYTINGSEAKKVMAQIKPREYVFPMHYGTKVFEDLLPPTEFLEGQDKSKVVADYEENHLTLNRDRERPRPLTIVMNYAPGMKKKKKQK
jgi:L-ascorbate metabolism protein UlaG (beta-lactamase superfamily)